MNSIAGEQYTDWFMAHSTLDVMIPQVLNSDAELVSPRFPSQERVSSKWNLRATLGTRHWLSEPIIYSVSKAFYLLSLIPLE